MQIGEGGEGNNRWHLGNKFSCSDYRYGRFITQPNMAEGIFKPSNYSLDFFLEMGCSRPLHQSMHTAVLLKMFKKFYKYQVSRGRQKLVIGQRRLCYKPSKNGVHSFAKHSQSY
jgi:hypothetical protein